MIDLRSKKLILSASLLTLLIAVPILIYFLFSQKIGTGRKTSDVQVLTHGVDRKLAEYGNHFNKVQVKEALDIINNESQSDSERYEALKDLSFYFSTAYAASHKPELREYAESIKTFAKENFPKLYEEGIFVVGCADPDCGEKPDEEIKQIQREIRESGIRVEHLNTINKNLEQAIYIPIEQIGNKKYGFGLVIEQLKSENNPKASVAAQRLTDYIKRKYSIEFTDVKIKEPEKL